MRCREVDCCGKIFRGWQRNLLDWLRKRIPKNAERPTKNILNDFKLPFIFYRRHGFNEHEITYTFLHSFLQSDTNIGQAACPLIIKGVDAMDKENCVWWSPNGTIFGCNRAKLSSLLTEISRISYRSNSTINPRLIMGANLTKEERFVWFVVCPQSFSGLVMSGLFYGWGALNGQLKNCCAFDNRQAWIKSASIYNYS